MSQEILERPPYGNSSSSAELNTAQIDMGKVPSGNIKVCRNHGDEPQDMPNGEYVRYAYRTLRTIEDGFALVTGVASKLMADTEFGKFKPATSAAELSEISKIIKSVYIDTLADRHEYTSKLVRYKNMLGGNPALSLSSILGRNIDVAFEDMTHVLTRVGHYILRPMANGMLSLVNDNDPKAADAVTQLLASGYKADYAVLEKIIKPEIIRYTELVDAAKQAIVIDNPIIDYEVAQFNMPTVIKHLAMNGNLPELREVRGVQSPAGLVIGAGTVPFRKLFDSIPNFELRKIMQDALAEVTDETLESVWKKWIWPISTVQNSMPETFAIMKYKNAETLWIVYGIVTGILAIYDADETVIVTDNTKENVVKALQSYQAELLNYMAMLSKSTTEEISGNVLVVYTDGPVTYVYPEVFSKAKDLGIQLEVILGGNISGGYVTTDSRKLDSIVSSKDTYLTSFDTFAATATRSMAMKYDTAMREAYLSGFCKWEDTISPELRQSLRSESNSSIRAYLASRISDWQADKLVDVAYNAIEIITEYGFENRGCIGTLLRDSVSLKKQHGDKMSVDRILLFASISFITHVVMRQMDCEYR